ncbi:MAG: ComEC/Rec2 family competence protein [Lachnospiraceae bacterium]|nr:ComEC/Rec2 family competence protein [Lachnospiraceae bacterium]
MKRPLCFLSISLILGVLAREYISSIYFLAFFLIAVFTFSYVLMLKTGCKEALMLPAAFALGLIIMGNSINTVHQDIRYFGEVHAEAVVERVSKSYSGEKIIVNVKNVAIAGDVFNTDFKTVVYTQNTYNGESGDIVEFKGVFTLPDEKTESGFNEKQYLGIRNIDYKVYTDSLIPTGKREDGIKYFLLGLRDSVMDVYDNIMPQEEAGILKAIIAGDKSYMSKDMLSLFRNAGLSHILAVSGLHVSIFTVSLFWVLNEILNIGKRKAAFIVSLFVICYTIIVGGSPSCMRAAVSSIIALFGIIIFKESDALNSLSIGIIILIILNPLVVHDIGFQMSFIATFFIIITFWASGSNALSMAFAAISLFPLTAYYYNEVFLAGIISSFLVVLFCGYVVGFGMLAGIAGLFSTEAARFLGGIVFAVLKYFEMVSYFADKLEFLKFRPSVPKLIHIAAYYAIILGFLYTVSIIRLRLKKEK